MNQAWICRTCAVQYEPSPLPPASCRICSDERQYVAHDGQRWTTLDELEGAGYRVDFRDLEPRLVGLGVEPTFGIGQRGVLVLTPEGNLLWDPPGYLDAAAVDRVRALGGLAAVAASHPHFYGVQVEWSTLFEAPLWVNTDDEEWLVRGGPTVRLWRGRAQPLPGVDLIQCGGHFAGSSVLHVPSAADGRGALLTGDTITVTMDLGRVSFMRSYPNHIPLPAEAVRRVVDAVADHRYDRIYGGWWTRVVEQDAAQVVADSAASYLSWLSGEAWREQDCSRG